MDQESIAASMRGRLVAPRRDPDGTRRYDYLLCLPTHAGGHDIRGEGEHLPVEHDENGPWGAKQMLERQRSCKSTVNAQEPAGSFSIFGDADGWSKDPSGQQVKQGVIPVTDPHTMNG